MIPTGYIYGALIRDDAELRIAYRASVAVYVADVLLVGESYYRVVLPHTMARAPVGELIVEKIAKPIGITP